MNKSEKFRELLAKEESLQNQLSDCTTAQTRMLKKAFKNLGLKLGYFSEVYGDRTVVNVAVITDSSVIYYRCIENHIETCEISLEDLFDAEDK